MYRRGQSFRLGLTVDFFPWRNLGSDVKKGIKYDGKRRV